MTASLPERYVGRVGEGMCPEPTNTDVGGGSEGTEGGRASKRGGG